MAKDKQMKCPARRKRLARRDLNEWHGIEDMGTGYSQEVYDNDTAVREKFNEAYDAAPDSALVSSAQCTPTAEQMAVGLMVMKMLTEGRMEEYINVGIPALFKSGWRDLMWDVDV
ncbi:hypothetical protein KIPB_008267 [Kipferlia bialata]|uniref:Uncharacterized protein n=1 Tax=Kipferlia bialata TaxID=797122 RepID=A0A9K3GH48_9EUKA|nr:hypothetical protein KIPB_003520 [Kipferlia bialata]GIQ86415.1 hypothetical protein KIPB_008267 [Kipferlia bialata]|eukprot:g3520.t1